MDGKWLILLFSTALVNNVVLSQFLGLCPFFGVSGKMGTALGMGCAVIGVISVSSLITGILYQFLLSPQHLEYLQTILFVFVIAALVQLLAMILKRKFPRWCKAFGVYLPLITTNCAVLGVSLTNVKNDYTILEGFVAGVGTSLGFMIALLLMAGIRERLERSRIPAAMKGMPIVMVTAGLMAIAFYGFKGLL